ncbi:hypothetical protein AAF712_013144 [Marasmius tenuissimus]|uniref:HAT C-terminal dimerisation domain-containing protein n=1 Tax=Marasmius tenuissimus TaxID=585030 RepID=A0ABR2ZFF3_9AGAR
MAWQQEMVEKFCTALNHYGVNTFPTPSTLPANLSHSSSATELLEDKDLLESHNNNDNPTEAADQEYSCYLVYQLKTSLKSLEFWKSHSPQFPHMAAHACDVLAIPGSPVAVEQALSVGQDVMGLHRQSMGASTIGMLMVFHGILMSEGVDQEDYVPQK